MYDRTTESLWSQIKGEAKVGDLLGSELKLFPVQLLTYDEMSKINNGVQILSTDIGYRRDYERYPYGNYEETEKLYFPINNPDKKLPSKTLLIASVVNNEAVAFHRTNLLSSRMAYIETASGGMFLKKMKLS